MHGDVGNTRPHGVQMMKPCIWSGEERGEGPSGAIQKGVPMTVRRLDMVELSCRKGQGVHGGRRGQQERKGRKGKEKRQKPARKERAEGEKDSKKEGKKGKERTVRKKERTNGKNER